MQTLRALPGVGDYTAAAVASIAFDLPFAAVDGNVLRVLARVFNDDGDIGAPVIRRRFQLQAQETLDPRRPGDFNQAMMELGATVCLPRNPRCAACPVPQSVRRVRRRTGCGTPRQAQAPAVETGKTLRRGGVSRRSGADAAAPGRMRREWRVFGNSL